MANSYSPGPPQTPSKGTPAIAHEKKRQPRLDRATLAKIIGLGALTFVVVALVIWAFVAN